MGFSLIVPFRDRGLDDGSNNISSTSRRIGCLCWGYYFTLYLFLARIPSLGAFHDSGTVPCVCFWPRCLLWRVLLL